MRLWSASLCILAVSGLIVDGSSHPALALWPQQVDAALSLSVNADGSSVVEASHGGALGTFNMKVETESEVLFDPLLDTIEILWTPAKETHSSTFDRFWMNSLRFDGINTVGIHLQVKLKDEISWNSVNEAFHERIEENVRKVLRIALPSIEILPELSKGFLAKSLCDFRSWKTKERREQFPDELVPESSSLCYSSSFPRSLTNESTSFFNRIIREANSDSVDAHGSVIERALVEAKQSLSTSRREHRLAVVTFGRHSAFSPTIEAEILEVWVSPLPEAKSPWKTILPARETKIDFLVVTSIARELDADTLEYTWVQRTDEHLPPEYAPSVLKIRLPKAAVTASVRAAIVGKGFHRRYVMDVELLESTACGTASHDRAILMRVPVFSTAYIDLDEIRRMERFGDLKLLSFTKHIEIERPSPVSSQYVIGLKFTIPSTNRAHIEFPIHFRYQTPSENDLYRQASVVAPDLFLVCPDGDQQNIQRKLELVDDDDATQSYFQTWGLTGLSDPASDDHCLRLATTFPLPPTDVLIPVGYLPSHQLVSSITLVFATMGAALLLWASIGVAKQAEDSCGASWKGKTD